MLRSAIRVAGKAIWLTETAQTACGGDRWASTFLDSFRYLNQLGSLAKLGVQVHMHNTLASSDYGLLDEKTFEPRPNYGQPVVAPVNGHDRSGCGASPAMSLHLYAQCMRGTPGGVTLLAINADKIRRRPFDSTGGALYADLNDLMSQTVS